VAGILVALLAVGGLSSPAFAAGGKVTVYPAQSGNSHDGLPVLTEGGTYRFQLGYGSMDDGAVSTIALPEGITIPDAALVVPAGNTAVASLKVTADHALVVTFKNPFPADVNQGVLDLSFVVDKVTNSEVRDLVWNVDGTPTTQRVIVTEPGENPQSTSTSSSKSVAGVNIPFSVDQGKVKIDPAALAVELPYTVTVSSKEARQVTIADTLGANLTFIPGSLTATKVVRDANDLNPVSSAVSGLPALSGTSFTHTFQAEPNSAYTFTYRAKIADQAALENIRAELQAAYDKVDKINGGSFSVSLSNQATINGETRSAVTKIGGNVQGAPRPGTGAAFGKSVDPTDVTLGTGTAAGSKLDKPTAVTYTLRADLTVFADFAGGPFALNRNVVIKDTLPGQASWLADASDFLVLTDSTGKTHTLTPAKDLTGDLDAGIASDDHVFTYAVSGQKLLVNIGKDAAASYTLKARATIDALPQNASSDSQYNTTYKVTNDAYFQYSADRNERKSATTTFTVPKDTTGGVNDPSRFAKSTAGGPITVAPGTATAIPYTFTVGKNIGDAATSRIVDTIDHDVFDVTTETLPEIRTSITGSYGTHVLGGNDFDLTLDAQGQLVIAPNASFAKGASAPLTGAWAITLTLPTKVLQGKQTIEISNSARYEGVGHEIVYTSVSNTKATSFGNELEVRKDVYDAAHDSFTSNLRVETAPDGTLTQDEFVYRVELLPHGTFSNMVEDVVDVLPSSVEFVGFVAPGDVASGKTADGSSYVIPGTQLHATYDEKNDTVTLQRGKLVSGQTVSLFFKVHVTEHKANVGITNMIGAIGATITPTNDFPLSLLKRDSTDATKLITDSDARFSVLAADKTTVVLSDLRVEEGKIRNADGTTPVVAQAGTYWLREDVAPTGYEKATDLSRIDVQETGNSADVVLYNTPKAAEPEPAKTYAVGDVVWIDADNDGIQDDSEQVLPGVTVQLMQDGKVIGSTTTDDRGRYMFDELSAGQYQVRFILTEKQSAVYSFTRANAGTDDTVESDADTDTGLTATIVLGENNINLTTDYAWGEVRATEGIDPTWDAGVIVIDTTVPEEPQPEPTTPVVTPTPSDTPAPAVDPAHPGTPGVNELAHTGGTIPFSLAGAALLLLLSGAGILIWRRRAA
jgi:DNA-directed RNA polymerase II subunit RPB1